MATNGFNLFDSVDDLKKAGMPNDQADILARVLHSLSSENAASKHDLEVTKLELKLEIEKVRKEIEEVRKEIEKMGHTLTVRVGLLYASSIGAILAMAKFGLLSIK